MYWILAPGSGIQPLLVNPAPAVFIQTVMHLSFEGFDGLTHSLY